MANVYSETTITLTAEEKELFEKTIRKLNEIVANVRDDTDLFVDADSIFACIHEAYSYKDKKLPTTIHIWE